MNKIFKTVPFLKAFLIFIFLILQFSCIHIEPRIINCSFKRTLLPINLNNDVILNTWESEKSLWHLSSFRIEFNNQTIYIDPVDLIDSVKADYIFITHTHPDHFSLVDLKKIVRNGTTIVAPKQLKKELALFSNIKFIPIIPGDKIQLNEITCEATPAYNLVHPKIFHFVGYILTLKGLRFYHAGDTGFFNEMDKINNIDVAILPIGSGSLAMTPEEAANAVKIIKPKIVIPMHYELNKKKAGYFKSLVNNVRVEILEQENKKTNL